MKKNRDKSYQNKNYSYLCGVEPIKKRHDDVDRQTKGGDRGDA